MIMMRPGQSLEYAPPDPDQAGEETKDDPQARPGEECAQVPYAAHLSLVFFELFFMFSRRGQGSCHRLVKRA